MLIEHLFNCATGMGPVRDDGGVYIKQAVDLRRLEPYVETHP